MSRLARVLKDFQNPITISLGVTTTISYGTLYYCFSVFAPVVSEEFGIGLDVFFAIFAGGLFLGGMFAPFVGRYLDTYGARAIMSIGSFAAFIALLLLSFANSLWTFAAAIVAIEFASSLVVYEAAFAGLTQIYGQNARRHITSVTLIAGFSSMIFWPLTQFLVTHTGWRMTCVIFALMHLGICFPLHLQGLKSASQKFHEAKKSLIVPVTETILGGAGRKRAIILFAVAVCVSGMVFAAFPVHLLIILQNQGITAGTASLIAMAMGPAQVLARIIEMATEDKHTALFTGRVCLAVLPLCILVLFVADQSILAGVLFTLGYGVSQGLNNIVRGTVPLHLFGSAGYATLVGKLTAIRYTLNSGAPFFFAIILTNYGMAAALWTSIALSSISVAAFWGLRDPQIKGD